MYSSKNGNDQSSDSKEGLLNDFLRELSSGLVADEELQKLNCSATNATQAPINNNSMLGNLGLNMSMGMFQTLAEPPANGQGNTMPFFLDESILSAGNVDENSALSYDWSSVTSQCFSVPHEVENSLSSESLNRQGRDLASDESQNQFVGDALNSFLQNYNTTMMNVMRDKDHVPISSSFNNSSYLNQAVNHLVPPMLTTAACFTPSQQRESSLPSGSIKTYLPQIMEGLHTDQKPVVLRSSQLIAEIAKKDVTRMHMLSTFESNNIIVLVKSIIVAINNNLQESKILKNLFSALYFFSRMKPFVQIVMQTQIIATITALLDDINMSDLIKFYIVSVLHNLCLYSSSTTLGDQIKDCIRNSGATRRLVPFLADKNVKFLAIVTDCLHLLAVNHQPTQMVIVTQGGLQELVNILRTNKTYEKLLYTTCRILKVLSVSPECKKVIVVSGGMQILSSLLLHPSRRLAANAIWTMRNLSDVATDEPGLDNLLFITIRFLHSQLPNPLIQLVRTAANCTVTPDVGHLYSQVMAIAPNSKFNEKTMVSCAIGILANLTCNNTHNKTFVFSSGGVEMLLGIGFMALQSNVIHHDVLEPSICALRHLTSRHADSSNACRTLIHCSGLQLAFDLLRFPFPAINSTPAPSPSDQKNSESKAMSQAVQLKRAVLGLFCNLASHDAYFAAVKEVGVTSECVQVLSFIYNYLVTSHDSLFPKFHSQLSSAMYSTTPSATSDQSSFLLHLDRLVEAGAGLLFLLSKDLSIFNLMCHTKDFLLLLYQLLTITQLPGSIDSVLALIYKISEQSHSFISLSREMLTDSTNQRNSEVFGLVRLKLNNLVQSMQNKISVHFDIPISTVAANILIRFCNVFSSMSPALISPSPQSSLSNSYNFLIPFHAGGNQTPNQNGALLTQMNPSPMNLNRPDSSNSTVNNSNPNIRLG